MPNPCPRHACKLGLEGIVSKQLGSRYRSGRPPDWLKFKNPERGADTLTSALTGTDGSASRPRYCLYLEQAREVVRGNERTIGKPSVLQTVSCTPCILSKIAGV